MRSRLLGLALIGLSGLAGILASGPAQAQPVDRYLLDRYFPLGVPGYDTEPGVTVTSRLEPEYEAPGVQVGGFIVRPQVNESLGYNDNVVGAPNGKGSFDVDTQAQVAVNSNWGRNSLGGLVSVENQTYPAQSSQNQTNWTASGGGTYEFGRDVLAVAYTHISTHQTPTDIATFPFEQPLPFTIDNVHISYTSPFGRVSLMPYFDYTHLSFSNGTVGGVTVSQQYRNSDTFQGGVEGKYEFATGHNAILEVQATGINYPNPSLAQALPNSTSVAVLAGLEYRGGVWLYQALAGFEQRNYATLPNTTTQFKNRSSPIAEASLIWLPTELTTVTGRFVYSIEDPTEQSTQGYNYASARVIVDHEYLRNVLLRGYLGLQHAGYVSVNYNQTIYQAGAGVTWLVNRNISVALTYDYANRQGTKNLSAPLLSGGLVPLSSGNYAQDIYLLQFRFKL
jgi:hypothetical protein